MHTPCILPLDQPPLDPQVDNNYTLIPLILKSIRDQCKEYDLVGQLTHFSTSQQATSELAVRVVSSDWLVIYNLTII